MEELNSGEEVDEDEDVLREKDRNGVEAEPQVAPKLGLGLGVAADAAVVVGTVNEKAEEVDPGNKMVVLEAFEEEEEEEENKKLGFDEVPKRDEEEEEEDGVPKDRPVPRTVEIEPDEDWDGADPKDKPVDACDEEAKAEEADEENSGDGDDEKGKGEKDEEG